MNNVDEKITQSNHLVHNDQLFKAGVYCTKSSYSPHEKLPSPLPQPASSTSVETRAVVEGKRT